MPSYGEPYLGEATFVGSTGASGTVNYNAVAGDVVLCQPDVEPVTVTLPVITGIFPKVAVQPSQAAIASGPPYYPTAPNAAGPFVKVSDVSVAGASGAVTVLLAAAEKTAGVKVNGATGAVSVADSGAVSFVAIGGQWYIV
jgi:hypothetical protein